MVFTFYVKPRGNVAATEFIHAACSSYIALRRTLSLHGFTVKSVVETIYTFGISYEFLVRPRSREVSFSVNSASDVLSYFDEIFAYPEEAEIELVNYPIFQKITNK